MIARAGLLGRSTALLALLSTMPAVAATNLAPIANAGPDRTGTVNVAITLNGSASYDPNGGSIAAYWWQFGDGSAVTTSTSSATHTYTAPAIYNVVLWVRDNAGAWSAAGDVARVTIGGTTVIATSTTTTTSPPHTTTTLGSNQAPTANAGPNQATQTLTTLTFNGSGSRDDDGYIAMASWAFGDGTTAGGLTVTHSYAVAGTYTATLSVLDNRGRLDTDTATITVANRAPIANAGANVAGTPGVAVSLNGSASSDADGAIVTWAWVFGDGTTGSGAVASHAYASAGTYTATLTVTDNKGARTSDSAVVTVATSGGSATWAKKIGSSSSDGGYAIRGDAAGNTVVGGAYRGSTNLGGTTLSSAGGADGYIAKYSPTGTLLWGRTVGGNSDDFVDGLTIDANGDVIVAGRFTGTAGFGGTSLVASGPSDMVIAKYSGANGAHLWSKRYGDVYDDAASAVTTDGANNVYFTGYFRGSVNFGGGMLTVPYTNDLDVFVTKLTSAGAYVWAKKFTNTGNERGYGIAADGAGNVAVTGSFSNELNLGGSTMVATNAMTDAFIVRFTTNGAHVWSTTLRRR